MAEISRRHPLPKQARLIWLKAPLDKYGFYNMRLCKSVGKELATSLSTEAISSIIVKLGRGNGFLTF